MSIASAVVVDLREFPIGLTKWGIRRHHPLRSSYVLAVPSPWFRVPVCSMAFSVAKSRKKDAKSCCVVLDNIV